MNLTFHVKGYWFSTLQNHSFFLSLKCEKFSNPFYNNVKYVKIGIVFC